MAVGLKSSMSVFLMITIMVASMQMQTSMAQTRHVVGDALGWTIPSNGAAAYTTWASQQTFRVGDSLCGGLGTSLGHNGILVMERKRTSDRGRRFEPEVRRRFTNSNDSCVSDVGGFCGCTVFNFTTGNHNVAEVSQAAYGPCTTANPISITTTGPATVALTTAGTHYYICTVGTHCQIGQKLTINVSAPAVAPTTPPPAAAPTTPPPAATPTTPPAATPTPAPSPTPATTPAPSPTPATTPAPSPTTPPPTSSEAPTSTGTSPPSGPSPDSDTTPLPPSPSAAARSLTTAVVPATFVAFAFALFY